ncbi:MAG: glycoside hydrolase family 27 protein, partial [Salana multivorans]|nr:glycoside hydrolase family 27 protein [Salana multivorans]
MARIPTPRPPMGWNSWDCFGTTVTEAEVLANAEVLSRRLARLGWDTVVVDIDWSDPTARSHGYNAGAPLAIDDHGRLLPEPGRFPSAAGTADGPGFAPLARAVHDLGLRFGIHTMRGIPRIAVERDLPILGTDLTASAVADPSNACEWNPDMVGLRWHDPDPAVRAACQAYYDSTLDLYASWGVDFIKADDMLWPYQAADIAAYARAIERSGRPIELSLSPGRDLSLARLDDLREHATMWRICDDLWDSWADVEANFARLARWAPHASPQGWPDGDMLPLGRISVRAERGEPHDSNLTPAEQRTLLTLWCVARSPLMVGGHLPASSEETFELLSNPGVLALLHASGSREVFREGSLVLWSAEVRADSLPAAYLADLADLSGADDADTVGVHRYVAAFNTGEEPLVVALDAGNVGLPLRLDGPVTDVWAGAAASAIPVSAQDDGARGVAPGSTAIPVTVEPHGVVLLRYLDRGT